MVDRTNPRRENKLLKIFSLVSVAILSLYLFYQSTKSITLTIEKVEIFNSAKEEVDKLRLKNVNLVLLSEKVVTDEYIESQARDRLNYAKDGEVIFIIPEDLLHDDALGEYIEQFQYGYIDPSQIVERSVYSQWMEFFTDGV